MPPQLRFKYYILKTLIVYFYFVSSLLILFFFFLAVLGFELRAFTLNHSTSPIFVKGFSR
jgi:ABC-type uncharacterized transport system permease subunit